jgi:hypothetical protein
VRTTRFGLAVAALVATLVPATAAAHDGGSPAATRHGPDPDVARQLAEVRLATARFHSVQAARRAGYEPAGACVEQPGTGAMGYHYANPGLAADPALDIRSPELLLYERAAGGRLRLTGVEYFRADADQNLSTDDDRPSLFGQPFDGPMLGHEPGQPIHYDLHAWVWKSNPAGTFAQYNPTVTCP